MTDFRSRQPHINRSIAPVDRNIADRLKLSLTDNEVPGIARVLAGKLAEKGVSVTTISATQLVRLTSPVVLPIRDEPYPSPVDEARAFPNSWQDFISHLWDMPWWRHQGKPTLAKVIEAVRNYHWQGGWFHYRPQSEAQSGGTGLSSIFGDE